MDLEYREPAKPRIVVFAGSLRQESLHRKLAKAAAAALEVAGANTIHVELKDYPMPLYDGDLENSVGIPDSVKALGKIMRDCDGLAIASPEYNGSFSPLVKNVIDWISRPHPGERHSVAFRGKVAGLLSATPGSGGGSRGLRHLREVLQALAVAVIPEEVAIPRALDAFDGQGRLVKPADLQLLENWANKLLRAGTQAKTTAA